MLCWSTQETVEKQIKKAGVLPYPAEKCAHSRDYNDSQSHSRLPSPMCSFNGSGPTLTDPGPHS